MQRTDYNQIAQEYKRAKQHPWRILIELYTMFQIVGDVTDRSVLDLACGEGFLTRELRRRGARRVVGVDRSHEMVELGRRQEQASPLGIDYVESDVRDLCLEETFDLVVAGYLLNYAQTRDQLLAMCQAITHHLRPGGRFVTVNNSPMNEHFPHGRPYGFDKIVDGELREGTQIIWRIYLEDGTFDIVNFHLDPSTHEWALRAAGFREIHWHDPRLDPNAAAERDFWAPFLTTPPIVFLECV